jgi:hypothetical protein
MGVGEMQGGKAHDGVGYEGVLQAYLWEHALPDVGAAGFAADAEAGGPRPVVVKGKVVYAKGSGCSGAGWRI